VSRRPDGLAASHRRAAVVVALLGGALTAPARAHAETPPAPPPQLATVEVRSARGMVVCSSPGAAAAGARILAGGGNAVDAAVAAALALGVGEFGASGLGGQTYMLVCLAGGRCVAIDGSAVVPRRAVRFELKQAADAGELHGHKVVAAPGTLAALAHALSRFGTRTLAEVLAPAIELADAGVALSPAQASYVEGYVHKLRESPYLANLLLRDSLDPWEAGHTYCLPDLGTTLRRIAAGGADDFYRGTIAEEIAADMAANGGSLREDDLERVRAREVEPYRGSYRGHEVISFPLPGSGGAVIQALQILDHFPASALRGDGAAKHLLHLEATRLALADEHRAMIPIAEAGRALADRGRARERAKLLRRERARTPAELGEVDAPAWFDHDTTHLSVADRDGNVVALTQTLGRVFGACTATPGLGFPYNDLLEAFDLDRPGSRAFLRPLQPPFTSQAPTIVRRDGRPRLVLGSVGSGRITSAIVLAISNVLDRGMSLGEAVAAPRVLWSGSNEFKLYIEIAGGIDEAVADELRDRGFPSAFRLRFPAAQGDLNVFGAVNAILVDEGGIAVGVGDPRRQGTAAAAEPAAPREPAGGTGRAARPVAPPGA